MAHRCAGFPHNPCRLGDPKHFKAGTRSRVTHKWAGWLRNPCLMGGPKTSSKRGTPLEVAHRWAVLLHNLCLLGRPQRFRASNKIRSGRKCTGWLHNPCHLAVPQPFEAGKKIRSDEQVGLVATKPLPRGRSPTLQSGGQHQKWPRKGTGSHISPATWGVPNASRWGTKSEVGHKRAGWPHNPRAHRSRPISGVCGYITPTT